MSPLPRLDDPALREAFAAATDGAEILSRRTVILLADMFGLAPMGVVWRLEKMGLARTGSLDWFRANGGITQEHVDVVRREAATALVTSGRRATACRPL